MSDDVDTLPMLEDCWNRIGVKGDRTCPELLKVGHCHNCEVFSAAGERLFMRPLPPEGTADRSGDFVAAEERGEQVRPVFVFRVGDEWYAVDVRATVEVAEPRKVHRVPHRRASLLRGLVNVRGELHLCISSHQLMHVEADTDHSRPRNESGWLLMIENQHGRWAFEVDEVSGVHRVGVDQLGGVPVTVAQGKSPLTQHVFVDGTRRIGMLDSAKLFALLEQTSW